MTHATVNWETIMSFFCLGTSTRWSVTQFGAMKTFFCKNMTRSSKAWHYFVCSKFMPTTNFNAVSNDIIGLTYAI